MPPLTAGHVQHKRWGPQRAGTFVARGQSAAGQLAVGQLAAGQLAAGDPQGADTGLVSAVSFEEGCPNKTWDLERNLTQKQCQQYGLKKTVQTWDLKKKLIQKQCQ